MDAPAWTRAERGVAATGLLATCAHLARFTHPDHAIDDAWISFRIARNLLDHGVLSFNLDQAPVEGMTNLLWTLLATTWIAAFPDLDPVVPARWIGGACLVGAAALGMATARRLAHGEGAGPRGRLLAVGVAAGLVATSGSLAWHATSGLETGLWTLLVAAALDAVSRPAARGPGLGLLLGAAFATRPEAGLLGPALLLTLAWPFRRPGAAARAAVAFLLVVGAVEAFRWGYYGSLVPNTFHAKPPDEVGAGMYASRAFVQLLGGGLGLLCLLPAAGRPRLAGLAAVAVVSFVGAVATGGDWMAGLRRLTEATWILYVVAAAALGAAVGRARLLGALGVAGLVGGSGWAAVRGVDHALSPHAFYGAAGALAAATPGVGRVGVADIGHFGWTFPGPIYDFAGLVDAHIARRPGSHGDKAWDEAWFRAQAPDLVLVTSLSPLPAEPGGRLVLRHLDLPVVASIRAHGGYTPWSAAPIVDDQWMIAFVRDGLTLPEAAWGPPDPRLRALFPPAADVDTPPRPL